MQAVTFNLTANNLLLQLRYERVILWQENVVKSVNQYAEFHSPRIYQLILHRHGTLIHSEAAVFELHHLRQSPSVTQCIHCPDSVKTVKGILHLLQLRNKISSKHRSCYIMQRVKDL